MWLPHLNESVKSLYGLSLLFRMNRDGLRYFGSDPYAALRSFSLYFFILPIYALYMTFFTDFSKLLKIDSPLQVFCIVILEFTIVTFTTLLVVKYPPRPLSHSANFVTYVLVQNWLNFFISIIFVFLATLIHLNPNLEFLFLLLNIVVFAAFWYFNMITLNVTPLMAFAFSLLVLSVERLVEFLIPMIIILQGYISMPPQF